MAAVSTTPTKLLTRTARTQALADFRYVLRRFVQFSEQAADHAGLTPQQHQLLLQIAGAPEDALPTIGYLAQRLALKHHSLVELANRSEDAGLLRRKPDPLDRRAVVLHLTPAGARILHELSEDHERELHEMAPRLIKALSTFTRQAGSAATATGIRP